MFRDFALKPSSKVLESYCMRHTVQAIARKKPNWPIKRVVWLARPPLSSGHLFLMLKRVSIVECEKGYMGMSDNGAHGYSFITFIIISLELYPGKKKV